MFLALKKGFNFFCGIKFCTILQCGRGRVSEGNHYCRRFLKDISYEVEERCCLSAGKQIRGKVVHMYNVTFVLVPQHNMASARNYSHNKDKRDIHRNYNHYYNRSQL